MPFMTQAIDLKSNSYQTQVKAAIPLSTMYQNSYFQADLHCHITSFKCDGQITITVTWIWSKRFKMDLL